MKVNLEVGRPPLYRNKTQNDIRVEEGAETGMRTGSYKMQIRSLAPPRTTAALMELSATTT